MKLIKKGESYAACSWCKSFLTDDPKNPWISYEEMGVSEKEEVSPFIDSNGDRKYEEMLKLGIKIENSICPECKEEILNIKNIE